MEDELSDLEILSDLVQVVIVATMRLLAPNTAEAE